MRLVKLQIWVFQCSGTCLNSCFAICHRHFVFHAANHLTSTSWFRLSASLFYTNVGQRLSAACFMVSSTDLLFSRETTRVFVSKTLGVFSPSQMNLRPTAGEKVKWEAMGLGREKQLATAKTWNIPRTVLMFSVTEKWEHLSFFYLSVHSRRQLPVCT